MYYREFYIRGAGREISSNSNRNEPVLYSGAPLVFNKFNVKTVELPLTFSPITKDREEFSFTTVYTTNLGNTLTFKDYITFTEHEYFEGTLLLSKIQALLRLHGSLDALGHFTAPTPGFVNAGVGPLFKLKQTVTVSFLDSVIVNAPFPASQIFYGKPYLVFDPLPTTANVDASIAKVVISFPVESQLTQFLDFPYWDRPTDWVTSVVLTSPAAVLNFLATGDELPTVRTRPSYLLLHSNLRAGFNYMSSSRPDNHMSSTMIAKVPIKMDSSQQFGVAAQIWTNEVQDPDLFMTANDSEYTELKFWFTYPDGITRVRFGGNNFSLTLSALVRNAHQ